MVRLEVKRYLDFVGNQNEIDIRQHTRTEYFQTYYKQTTTGIIVCCLANNNETLSTIVEICR